MNLAGDVTALQSRLAEAHRVRARAEGAREAAQHALDKARTELAEEFGVKTAEEAEQLLAELRVQLERLVAQITRQLDAAEVRP